MAQTKAATNRAYHKVENSKTLVQGRPIIEQSIEARSQARSARPWRLALEAIAAGRAACADGFFPLDRNETSFLSMRLAQSHIHTAR